MRRHQLTTQECAGRYSETLAREFPAMNAVTRSRWALIFANGAQARRNERATAIMRLHKLYKRWPGQGSAAT